MDEVRDMQKTCGLESWTAEGFKLQ
jgi:hypothetical protein